MEPPEHDLILAGMQVASTAGLKDPSGSVMSYRQTKEAKQGSRLTLGGLLENTSIRVPTDSLGRTMCSTLAMLTSASAYQRLLRGNAPQSHPFCKWVTEEVPPSDSARLDHLAPQCLTIRWPKGLWMN